MFKIKFIVIGKIKEKYFREAENEFIKRLKPYAKLEIFELKEEPFRENYDAEKIKHIEGEKILNALKDAEFTAMDKGGRQYSSEELAEFIEEQAGRGKELIFVIGGALGLGENVLKRSSHKISLSKMTFTHTMARIFLLEQIYRAAAILKGKKYHY